MKYKSIKNGPEGVSLIIQGCMRMKDVPKAAAAAAIRAAWDCGVNFFDHATCYGNGLSEERFGEAFPLTGLRREEVFLQGKCGIQEDRRGFDWRKEYILTSVDNSLKRLKTDYLDTLLLHRPDLLFEPEEVAEAFDALHRAGKVRWFGVSNLMPMQIELLKKELRQPLVISQVQLSLEQSQLIDQGLYMNCKLTERSVSRDDSLLDYCRLHDIALQAWSPLQKGMFGGTFVDDPEFPELNRVLGELAEREGVSKTAVALAWILRHPAKIQPLLGSMNPAHIRDACAAADITLSHSDWYELYLAAGKFLP